jgi:hypothetical protein
MIFNQDIWYYIKSFLFDPNDINRRIRHHKENIRVQLIFKNYYFNKYDLLDKIMGELSDSDTGSDSDFSA